LFAAASGRCYEEQKTDPKKQSTLPVTDMLSGIKNVDSYDYSGLWIHLYLCKNYTVDEFIKTIKSRKISYANRILSYNTPECSLELEYGKDFKVNGRNIDVEYPRLETTYVKAGRKPKELQISFEGSSLYLNFDRRG
jgi:hypothetical protein